VKTYGDRRLGKSECPFTISDDKTTQLPIIKLLINLRRIVNPLDIALLFFNEFINQHTITSIT